MTILCNSWNASRLVGMKRELTNNDIDMKRDFRFFILLEHLCQRFQFSSELYRLHSPAVEYKLARIVVTTPFLKSAILNLTEQP
jgi:hypothetical protein